MKKTIQSIELVLENVEAIFLKASHIDFLSIDGITKSIQFNSGSISKTIQAEAIKLKIKAKANTYSAYIQEWSAEERLLPFDRIIKYNDITVLELYYTDGTSESICTNWDDACDEINGYQSTTIEWDGSLWIRIDPNQKTK